MADARAAIGRDLDAAVHGEDGPWLTLIHGGLAHSPSWGYVLAALAGQARVLAYDLRGYGDSAPAATGGAAPDHARDLLELWDALGVDRGYVAGFSFGGMIAQEVAITAPERVAGLVLVSTATAMDAPAREAFDARAAAIERGDGATELAEHVGRAFSADFAERHPETVDEYRRLVLSNDPLAAARTFRAVAAFDRAADLGRIRCPTLVVVGDLDAGMGPARGRELGAGIPGAESVVLRGRGHTIHIESPAAFSHLVADFMEQHPDPEEPGGSP